MTREFTSYIFHSFISFSFLLRLEKCWSQDLQSEKQCEQLATYHILNSVK